MSYTATLVKDLSATTPTEGSTLPSELNDAIREIKSVMLYEKGLLAKTADYSMDAKDCVVICTPTSVDITITLPQASACATSAYYKLALIRNYGTYDVIIDGYSSETIDAGTTLTLRPGQAAILVCNGTGWYSFRPQPKFRGARVKNSADQAIDGDGTVLTFDTDTYDTDSIHSTSVNTERLVTPSGVNYIRLLANVMVRDDETTDITTVTLYEDGVAIQTATVISDTDYVSSAGYTIQLDSGVIPATADKYYHLAINGITNNTESDYTWFAMEIVE